MTTALQQQTLLEFARISLCAPKEYGVGGLIMEAFIQHKSPPKRYAIFPQILPFKHRPPHDRFGGTTRALCLGQQMKVEPYVHLQGGVEIMDVLPEMAGLPAASTLEDLEVVRDSLAEAYLQAQDKVGGGIEAGFLPDADVPWLLFVGPYFAPVTFSRVDEQQPAPRTHSLYLLGTPEAAEQIELFLSRRSKL
ncbi:hypothetical protein BOTBODRAFT_446002 [Botryobasidium botryosum FD-172 SS1]|uniref:Uncharacterized protein n=1 Tax=Botryobasidium botryosum (strain FD-172 SS1) TaxID=930990 RepID=A0A067MIQ1_BOTB1|nr:hypothetical protein BOTBODRAFT_446002 [Botryobasidium botryosum FD-172 SS1]